MNYKENLFKKYLISEVMRQSNTDIKDAIHHVYLFAKTDEFKSSFEKWKLLESVNDFRPSGPRKMFS